MSLEVRIKKEFKTFQLNVDFKAEDETLGFLGASGCGKSLTLRCIAGIEKPDEGRIVVNGKVFYDSKARINLTPQQRKTALLFQNYMLFPNFTIEKNVAAGIDKKTPEKERAEIVAAELERFGLKGFEKRYPAQLSGGQQQRVALARMLAARPDILMLDEPFSALDSHLKDMLEQNLVSLFDSFKGTILYVSHDIDEAIRFCDRIAVVETGHILEIDNQDELVNNPKSGAAIKLSGCRNAPHVEYVDDHTVYAEVWGINIHTEAIVPKNVKYIGIRSFYLERADGPGLNNFRVQVCRISDSRFERSVLMHFMDSDHKLQGSDRTNEMKILHHMISWKLDKLNPTEPDLKVGDEFWLHLPPEKIYVVNQ
jgi:molybdate transport system ATP-binding protein